MIDYRKIEFNALVGLDDNRFLFPDCFPTPARIVGHYRRPARLGLKVHGGVVVLSRGVEEDVCRRIDRGELLTRIGTANADDTCWEPPDLLPR